MAKRCKCGADPTNPMEKKCSKCALKIHLKKSKFKTQKVGNRQTGFKRQLKGI